MLKTSSLISIDQTWEYGPAYHNHGRFLIREQLALYGWRCEDLNKDKTERCYDELDILTIAAPTRIQIGQTWLTHRGLEVTIINPLEVEVFGTPPMSYWHWRFQEKGYTSDVFIEQAILRRFTYVDPSAANAPSTESVTPKPQPIQRCPLCGARGFRSFNMFECSSPDCRNYVRPKF